MINWSDSTKMHRATIRFIGSVYITNHSVATLQGQQPNTKARGLDYYLPRICLYWTKKLTVKELEFSSFSNALNTNTGKRHPITHRERHRKGVDVYLYFFFHYGVVKPTPRQLNPGKESRYPLYTRPGGPGTIWTCTENIASTHIRTPNRPAYSQELFRLHNSGPPKYKYCIFRMNGAKSSKTEKLGMIWWTGPSRWSVLRKFLLISNVPFHLIFPNRKSGVVLNFHSSTVSKIFSPKYKWPGWNSSKFYGQWKLYACKFFSLKINGACFKLEGALNSKHYRIYSALTELYQFSRPYKTTGEMQLAHFNLQYDAAGGGHRGPQYKLPEIRSWIKFWRRNMWANFTSLLRFYFVLHCADNVYSCAVPPLLFAIRLQPQ